MKIIFVMFAALFFSACIDVNLKSELPKLDYYELDNTTLQNAESCGAYNIIGLNKIEIPARYQNAKILYKEDSRVSNLEGVNLSNSLENSLESMMIKNFSSKCFKMILPPFSGINVENYLSVKLLDFIIDKETLEAKVSLFYQVYGQGAVLQSGLLEEVSKLDSFNAENAIKALQNATLSVIDDLSNKMIPK